MNYRKSIVLFVISWMFALVFFSCDQLKLVRITSPSSGAVFDYGEEITFSADTGDAVVSSITWTSSIDGEIGTGASVTTTALSVGSHTITLTATLADASTETDSIAISVNPPPIVEVSDHIDTLTTWKSTNIYVVTRWFNVTGALIIEPGTIVKFMPNTEITVLGTLSADGTEESPIIFTSYKDDVHGGDTNGDGSLTSPLAGDWGQIIVEGNRNESVFNHCRFYYGGSLAWKAFTLRISSDDTTITNCIFAHNMGDNGQQDNADCVLNALGAGSRTIITGNIFYDNEKPLRIGLDVNIDDSNIFHNPEDPTQTNTCNAILVSTYADMSGDITWAETEVPFVIEPWSMHIPSGCSLTLADGIIVKFNNNRLDVEDDNLYNYDGDGVWFTSYKDDSLGGDSNGDGALTSPADGDWICIRVFLPSGGKPCVDWENILYDDN